jgi:signal transduction histidine kinase
MAVLQEKNNFIADQNEELHKHRNHLADLVEQRTDKLREAYQKLEKLDEAKSYFLGLLAHELGTPLNSILGGLRLLSAQAGDSDEKELAEMILHSAKRLDRFSNISRLLTTLKMGSYRLECTPCSVHSFIDEAVDHFKQGFEESKNQNMNSYGLESKKKLEIINKISEDNLSGLCIDQNLVTQALNAIFDNSVKYSGKNDIVITISGEAVINRYRLYFDDNGGGFDKSFLESEISLFASTPELMYHSDGVGLSLSTAKFIMEYHEGSIEIANIESGGARVILEFPLPHLEIEN